MGPQKQYDGGPSAADASIVPALDPPPETERRDVERRRTEKALVASQAALERALDRLRALTASLFTAQEEERRRVSHELHDDFNQKLAMLAVDLEALQQQPPPNRGVLQAQLESLKKRAAELSDDLRRMAYQLHPSILEHLGLEAALTSYCVEFSRREGVVVRFSAQGVPRGLAEDIALCLYRVAQEALRNVARHSGAQRASVTLSGSRQGVRLTVADRGAGFDPATVQACGGLGLLSMEERVRQAGGSLRVKSRPGKGTRIEAHIPLAGSPC